MASAAGANRMFYKAFALLSPQKIQPIERCHIGIKKIRTKLLRLRPLDSRRSFRSSIFDLINLPAVIFF